jgi:hypothetical protein
MTISLREFFRNYRLELGLGLFAAAVFAAFFFLKLQRVRFAGRAAKWPAVRATVENVFLDVENDYTGGATHAVLGYGYSIADSFYSGQIRLWVGGPSLEPLQKAMVGQRISVQYDPQHPEISIFLIHKVHGWDVVKDGRLSAWYWIDGLF